MAKRKKKHDTSKYVKELSLILPAFSYMWDRIEKVDDEDKKGSDYTIAKAICRKMAFIAKRFPLSLQRQALELSNKTMQQASDKYIKENDVPDELIDEYGGLKVNVFSLGLALFGVHHEHTGKVIHIGLIDLLVELQGFCEENMPKDEINRSYKYAEYVYEYTMGKKL